MYNITLVCTRHDELGKCNSNELYKIIESINPEVIFEEIPPSFFDRYYISKSRNNLETDTINKYLEIHKIEHIPVDSDELPSESFFKDHRYIYERVEGLADINGFNYRNLVDKNKLYAQMHGFPYLNSIYCTNFYDEINDSVEKGLQKINIEKYLQTFQLWKDINDGRENEMLQNIYRYSKEHSYNTAIFTIGAAHRKSIIKKIQDYQENEILKLNWTFYNDSA